MPKRQNPFGDGSPLQFKSHISTMEIDRGVNAKENMRAVYEKTRNLLFQGAQKPSKLSTEDSMSELVDPVPQRGQLRLDASGGLCCKPDDSTEVTMADAQVQPMEFGNFNNNCLVVPAGQLQIDSTGHLCSGVKVMETSVLLGSHQCTSCHRPSSTQLRPCQFCERQNCAPCMVQCCNCQGQFCHVCSVMNYDSCVERAFCLQCCP